MSNSPKIKVIRAWSRFISWKAREDEIDIPEHKAFPDQKTYWTGEGFYWGTSRCVKIYGIGPYNTRKTYEIKLELRIDGVEYERIYYRRFTERGLCLIASKLIRDAEKMHKRRKRK